MAAFTAASVSVAVRLDAPAWLRRAAPVALAALLHAVAAWLLIFLMRPPAMEPAAPRAIAVELVRPAEPVRDPVPALEADPVETAPAPGASSAPVAARPAAGLEAAPADPSGAGPAPADPAPAAAPPDLSAGTELDAEGGVQGETALPARSSALRGLACARAFEGDRAPVGCEGVAGRYDFSRFAGATGAAQVEAEIATRFNLLAGLFAADLDPAARRLPGQQGMEVMDNRRMGSGGADAMRDTLPALTPDPAFGD